jgi:hypothetical protein
VSGEKARRWTIAICAEDGGLIHDTYEYKHDHGDGVKEEEIEVAEVSALRAEWDAEFEEAIKWPKCPNEHPQASAWIEGRDAAVKAFARGLNRSMEEERGHHA